MRSTTTAETGLNSVSSATKFAARAMCPVPRGNLAKAAARLRSSGMAWVDNEDLEQDTWLLKLENPAFDASKLVASAYKKNLQLHQKSIMASVSIDAEFEGEDGSFAIQIAAAEQTDIERWRYMEPPIDVDKVRQSLRQNGKIGDRQARNLINATAKRIADQRQPELFGWEGGAA